MRVIDIQSTRLKTRSPEAWDKPSFSSELRIVHKAKSNEPVEPLVAILLCIFHGKKYLAEQLESIANQSHRHWKLFISDDGDCPESRKIIDKFKSRFEIDRIFLFSGPKRGFAANFLSLLEKSGATPDYYAFSDQDDIWECNKISSAVTWLESIPENIPALYCGRARLVDKNNKPIGFSPLFTRPPGFKNALVQTIGGGNTMIMNRSSRNLLNDEKLPEVVSHDWWAYLVVSGCGGKIFYDNYPKIRYRQHDHNLVGSNATIKGKLKRIRMLLNGYFRHLNDVNIYAIENIKDKLTDENKIIFEVFKEARKSKFIKRLLLFNKTGIYRQTILGNFGLFFAVVFRKL
jgi:glycosyltransferase involved in cell wall biosynthesis